MAALRNTDTRIYAVEIDPFILKLGNDFRFEKPYRNPRVEIVVDDARSFFQQTRTQFALAVFGFLDSHTLLSSFSSLRLDNFVYTRQSLERVKAILLPGGQVTITFASNTPWIHQRIISLLNEVFDAKTQVQAPRPPAYGNGIVYRNFKAPLPPDVEPREIAPHIDGPPTPTDDWPFLYLERPGIPGYYWLFLVLIFLSAVASLVILPAGERRIRLPYFFLGAAFFLLETSNVVSLSLLYGSTWIVNICVFSGVLVLILLGNALSSRGGRSRIGSDRRRPSAEPRSRVPHAPGPVARFLESRTQGRFRNRHFPRAHIFCESGVCPLDSR
jgi:hypothetical protein